MISRYLAMAITAAVAFVVAVEPVQASSASREASRECKEAMEDDHNADGFHDVSVSHRGSEYKVVGYAERRDYHDQWFECWSRHGRVTDIDFDGWDRRSGSSDKGKAIAAGIALAAIVAAAASAKKHHDDHDDDYRYDSHHRNYDDRDAQWHPARGVTCYKYTHRCYSNDGGYSAYWTNREFH